MSNGQEYIWTDNPTVHEESDCDTDVLNDCLMHLKYENKSGDGFHLFDTKITNYMLSGDDSVGWVLQGDLVTNIYPDAVKKIKDLYEEASYTEYRGISCKMTEDGRYIADITKKTDIDNLYNLTGFADFYVLDIENNQFFLPKILKRYLVDKKEPTSDNPTWYNLYSDGWLEQGGLVPNRGADNVQTATLTLAYKDTNYYANINFTTNSNTHYSYTGFIKSNTKTESSFQFTCTGDTSLNPQVYWNASGYSTIPENLKEYVYYKVGDDIVNASKIDAAQIVVDLQQKAQLDFSNCTKPYVTETFKSGTSWYRLWSDGWIEQGGVFTSQAVTTITFLKPYTTSNTVLTTNIAPDDYFTTGDDASLSTFSINRKTLESFRGQTELLYYSAQMQWYAFGY